jgi:uncharacterized protein YwqG
VVSPYHLALSQARADDLNSGLHQMLGHAKDRQGWARELRETHILLLQLDSDYGLNWIWGDCGSLEFWIKRSDLAARHFGAVIVKMVA